MELDKLSNLTKLELNLRNNLIDSVEFGIILDNLELVEDHNYKQREDK